MSPAELILKIKELVLKQAESNRNDAGHGGRHDDGGASMMEANVRFYECGQQGKIPSEWKEHAATVTNAADPDYPEYLRLKAKFDK
jgi:hypothetical protein